MTGRPGLARYDDIVDAITAWHPECRASKIFGMACVKRSGRVVFGLTRKGMVFKLTDPEAHARALSLPGAHLFDPGESGSPFRAWVVVPAAHEGEVATRYLNLHVPSCGFGAYLRGGRPGFDQHEPPPDGGADPSAVLVRALA